jgi:hypothetical protein
MLLWLEEQGTPMDAQTFGGLTILHLAAEVGDRETIAKLLADKRTAERFLSSLKQRTGGS